MCVPLGGPQRPRFHQASGPLMLRPATEGMGRSFGSICKVLKSGGRDPDGLRGTKESWSRTLCLCHVRASLRGARSASPFASPTRHHTIQLPHLKGCVWFRHRSLSSRDVAGVATRGNQSEHMEAAFVPRAGVRADMSADRVRAHQSHAPQQTTGGLQRSSAGRAASVAARCLASFARTSWPCRTGSRLASRP
jgi:hypothetical protein